MTSYLRVFARGWLQVSLVAANTSQIAQQHYAGAAMVGFLISAVWWSNSSAKREQFRGAGLVYALGASAGTLTGMWVVS